jgi:type IV secretory pathway TrbL component
MVAKARYNPSTELRREIASGVREGMKRVKRSARAFEGSRLRKRTGKTARTIGSRVRMRRRSEGISAPLTEENSDPDGMGFSHGFQGTESVSSTEKKEGLL